MRNITAVIALSVLAFSCATTSTPSRTNSEYLRSLYDAFGRGDVPTVLAAFDPSIEWYEAENFSYAAGNPYRGPQAIVQGIFARIGSEWTNFKVTPERFIDGGDVVAVTGRYDGTFNATRQPLHAQFAHVWTFRNGKIVRFEQYTDTSQFARVMAAAH